MKNIIALSTVLALSTAISGCSSWGNNPPPRYNTVVGGKRVPALNPGGSGDISHALAVKKLPPKPNASPASKIIPPQPKKMAFAKPSGGNLVDDAALEIMFADNTHDFRSGDVSVHPSVSAVQANPVPKVVMTPIPADNNLQNAKSYPKLSNVPKLSDDIVDRRKNADNSLKSLEAEHKKSAQTKKQLVKSVADEKSVSPNLEAEVQADARDVIVHDTKKYNPNAKYMTSHEIDNMFGVGANDAITASSAPTTPIISKQTASNIAPTEKFTPVDDGKFTPVAHKKPIATETKATMPIASEVKPAKTVAISNKTITEQVAIPPHPALQNKWQPVDTSVPAIQKTNITATHSPPAFIVNDDGSSTQIVNVDGSYEAVSDAIESFGGGGNRTTLVSPEEYNATSDQAFLPESRYAKRNRNIKRRRLLSRSR